MAVSPVRLNHAVLLVADLEAEVRRWAGVRTAGRLTPEPVEAP